MKELESLKSIFKDSIFKIPDYQRGYAWTTSQLKDFWEDIINLPIHKMHYTGVLTLKRVDENVYSNWNDEGWLIKDRGYKPFHIVDGQQRLTTFVIFIQSITELIKRLPDNDKKLDEEIYLGSFNLKQIKETYINISKPPQFIINTYMFGYETDNPSFKYLRHRIFNEPDGGKIDETFYTLNLENAKKFFVENLTKHFEEYGIADIELLYKKVTQNLMFNVYEIGDDFDVFVAFETMNNRGKKLSNLELLKNRLIYLTTLYETDELKKDDNNALREKINDAWKEVYHQIGRNKQKPLNDDDFLVAHWIMYFQYTRQKGDDYIRFLLDAKFTAKNIFNKVEIEVSTLEDFELINEDDNDDDEIEPTTDERHSTKIVSKLTPKEIEKYVNSLRSAAVHWYNTYNPANNDDLTQEEQLWIERLNRIGIIYFRPLVAASFLAPNVTPKERVRLFEAIEKFIFIIFRMGRAFSTYRNSEFFKSTRMLRMGEITVEDVIRTLEERMDWSYYKSEKDGKNYFDYEHFQKYIQKKIQSKTGFYGWNGLRYFLYEYEMEKLRHGGNQKIDWKLFVKNERDKISIEHIYPQTHNNKCWTKAFKGISPKQKEILAGSLGNLLPLSMSINSSLQNDCFMDKKTSKLDENGNKLRRGYDDGSHSEIEVASYNDWTPKEILERGILLLKFMERRWGIKFESEVQMKKLLFLEFLNNENNG